MNRYDKTEAFGGSKSQAAGHTAESAMGQDVISLNDALAQGVRYLSDHGIEDAQTDAWLLLEYVTGITRAFFLAERRQTMKRTDRKRYEELLGRRASHIPLQHLTGEQEFMGLSFAVSRHVLIPRQDTETLVEEALSRLKPGMRVLDLCTGSGCIAVSLAKLGPRRLPPFLVDAADISPEALEVAKENGMRKEVSVRWICSDLFAQIPDRYDMIVSNPPYICTAVIDELSEEVRLHEPRLALDGKADGLYFYRRIVEEGRSHLNPGGHLLFEIGYDQGEAVSGLMAAAGFEEIRVIRDLAGKERVAAGFWPERNV